MQNLAFTAAIALLVLGGLLNLVVVILLTLRAARGLFPKRVRRSGGAPAKLAAAHR